jgi:predicted O-methyltransferase YrrM
VFKKMFKKLLTGGQVRPPRWCDNKGNFVGISRLARNAPLACWTGLGRICVGVRPHLPWISYDAIRLLNTFLNRTSKVLEFGSGMSTVWYAQRSFRVFSVDDDSKWFDLMQSTFQQLGIDNVTYQLAHSADEYAQFGLSHNLKYDLIMVDGSVRSECIKRSLDLLANGGIIYLDNSDKHPMPVGGDTRIAEDLLLRFAKEQNGSVQYFTDFAPTQFFAQQGMLVKLRA